MFMLLLVDNIARSKLSLACPENRTFQIRWDIFRCDADGSCHTYTADATASLDSFVKVSDNDGSLDTKLAKEYSFFCKAAIPEDLS